MEILFCILLLLIVDFFIIFKFLREGKALKNSHDYKILSLENILKSKRQYGKQLDSRHRVLLDYEFSFKKNYEVIANEIVELQHMFLKIITRQNK